MIKTLNQLIDLPIATSPTELAHAADQQCRALFGKASDGDANAQRELVELHVAYLTWAYTEGHTNASPSSENDKSASGPI